MVSNTYDCMTAAFASAAPFTCKPRTCTHPVKTTQSHAKGHSPQSLGPRAQSPVGDPDTPLALLTILTADGADCFGSKGCSYRDRAAEGGAGVKTLDDRSRDPHSVARIRPEVPTRIFRYRGGGGDRSRRSGRVVHRVRRATSQTAPRAAHQPPSPATRPMHRHSETLTARRRSIS
jgi:hypothetical protein